MVQQGILNQMMPAALCNITIYASQLASCIGYNRFKKANEALESVWQRIAPASFKEALLRNGIKSQDDVVKEIMTSNQTVRTLLVHAEDTMTTSSEEVAREYEEISHRLADAELNWTDRKMVDDVMKKTMYTSFGTRHESVALSHIQEQLPCRPDNTFYRTWVTSVANVDIYLGGKIDAISQDGSTIVEVKNRINRLFYSNLPKYEILQVQTYLHLIPSASSARLVECLTRENGTLQTNMIHLERDPELWTLCIIPKLRGFVKYLIKILQDPVEQDAYLQSHRRTALVTKALHDGSSIQDDSWRCLGPKHPVYDGSCNSQKQKEDADTSQSIAVPNDSTHTLALALPQEI